MNIITIIAVALSSIVVLITLGKISRQMDKILSALALITKKLASLQEEEETEASVTQSQISRLSKDVQSIKGDHGVDWKG